MSIPLFFPTVEYVPELSLGSSISLGKLCLLAGVPCRASGKWTERKVEVVSGKLLRIIAEPGDWGAIKIEVPAVSQRQMARLALAAMAYGIQDLVARQSISHSPWTRLTARRGRPRTGCALSAAERQQRFRSKRKTCIV